MVISAGPRNNLPGDILLAAVKIAEKA